MYVTSTEITLSSGSFEHLALTQQNLMPIEKKSFLCEPVMNDCWNGSEWDKQLAKKILTASVTGIYLDQLMGQLKFPD